MDLPISSQAPSYRPWLVCVECDCSSDIMLKRTHDKFAVPLCANHCNAEHIELTYDKIQGYYFIVGR